MAPELKRGETERVWNLEIVELEEAGLGLGADDHHRLDHGAGYE